MLRNYDVELQSPYKPKTKAFVEHINKEIKKPLSKLQYILPAIAASPAAVAGALPYYNGGIDLADGNSAYKIIYPTAGMTINGVLYFMFAFGLTRLIFELINTPSSFRQLMPRENMRIFFGMLAFLIIMAATWSAVPYLAMAQMTGASLGITVDAVASNIIAHGEAFRLALTTDNVMFLKHPWELIRSAFMACCSTQEKRAAYKTALKHDHVMAELSNIIGANFKRAISGNYGKMELDDLLNDYHPTLPNSSALLYLGRKSTAAVFCSSTFISLSGYLASAYLALKKDVKNAALALAGTIGANIMFMYLVMKSVYKVATTQIFDPIVQLIKDIVQRIKDPTKTINLPNWFSMHKALSLIMLPFILFCGLFSFPSSIYLIQKSFPQIPGLSPFQKPFEGVTYPSAGVFNMVGAKDFMEFLSVLSQMIKDIIGYKNSNGESVALLADIEAQENTEKSYEQRRSDLYYDVTSAKINRLVDRVPNDNFLEIIEDLLNVSLPENADEKIRQLSNNKLQNMDELRDFINEGIIPAAYEDTSPYYAGRNVIVSKVKSGFFYMKECLPCANSNQEVSHVRVQHM